MENCFACGMPLNKDEDKGYAGAEGVACVYCTSESGEIRSCEEIFEGGVSFFMTATGSDREMAERLVRKNMKSLPYWQANPCDCLDDGEEASDSEFAEAMERLQGME